MSYLLHLNNLENNWNSFLHPKPYDMRGCKIVHTSTFETWGKKKAVFSVTPPTLDHRGFFHENPDPKFFFHSSQIQT